MLAILNILGFNSTMKDVEILRLGEFDDSNTSREFEAVSFERYLWRGILKCEEWQPGQYRVYVFPDRENRDADEYAVRPGMLAEVQEETSAKKAIKSAITNALDHRQTTEVISDGRGGWINIETNT